MAAERERAFLHGREYGRAASGERRPPNGDAVQSNAAFLSQEANAFPDAKAARQLDGALLYRRPCPNRR